MPTHTWGDCVSMNTFLGLTSIISIVTIALASVPSTPSIQNMSPLTDAQRQAFITDGYIILRGAVPSSLLQPALSTTDAAYTHADGHRGAPFQHLGGHPSLMALFERTCLHAAVAQLLGGGDNVALREGVPQVAYTETGDAERAQKWGVTALSDAHPNDRWHVDSSQGRFGAIASDFLMLVGIALSDGQQIDENRGQLVAFPGSHTTTHKRLSELINTTENVSEVVPCFRWSNLDVGKACRILLSPGDAVITHQRVAHCAGLNLGPDLRKNLYFRVEHVRFPGFARNYAEAHVPWMGFSGLSDMLPPTVTEIEFDDCDDDGVKRSVVALRGGVAKTLSPKMQDVLNLSEGEKQAFVRDGFLTLPGVVRPVLLQKATSKIERAHANGKYRERPRQLFAGSSHGFLSFGKQVCNAPVMTNVLTTSGLVDVAEQLLTEGNVLLIGSKAEVVYVPPSDVFLRAGVGEDDTCMAAVWKTGAAGSSGIAVEHLVTVCVVLSDDLDVDDNRGQMLVWPGSHVKTHKMIADIMSANKDDDAAQRGAYRAAKATLDVGQPQKLRLARGDVVVLHGHTATAFSPNMRPNPTLMLQFHLQIVDMLNVNAVSDGAHAPFAGFDGLRDVMSCGDDPSC